MALFSNSSVLSDFIERAYEALLKNRIEVIPESFKEIDYGISFKVVVNSEKKETSVAVYHTEKKGFSFVTKNSDIRSILNGLLTSTGIAGSDEAGKGDFFGPLVVCSFVMGQQEESLLKLNIKDSKKLKNDEVLRIYSVIALEYPSSFSVVRIMPERYNSFYEDLSKNGKNLNSMLGWAHSKAISGLIEKRGDVKKIIVDRFTENTSINGMISNASKGVPVEFFVRAEQNPVVAAASIIARAVYLKSLEQISETVLEGRFKLISGSGAPADSLLSIIKDNFGVDILSKVCKKHFANFQKTEQIF